MLGKATQCRKRMELLHDMMVGGDYGHLRDLTQTDQDVDRIVRMQVRNQLGTAED